jgi:exodeoxyribonuclease VII large subunit
LQVFTVTELNNSIKALIDSEPWLSSLAVRGELSNYKIYPSGHHYFTLKDKDSTLRCVMFRTAAGKLRFKPENGMSVIVSGRITVYPRDGAYQLYCNTISPEGLGDLQAAFEQVRAKLEAEGLFDRARKKPLPQYPGRIALVTSSAGAAVRDMIRILGARWPLAEVVLLPVRVQGAEAPAEIAGAIAYADRHRVADVIITGRGGGSLEDLWAFNDERVARAIASCSIPVISAVGHEPDVTISDYVADVRASTPSNAAEIVVPDINEILQRLDTAEFNLTHNFQKRLELLRARIVFFSERPVLQSPDSYIIQRRIALDSVKNRLCAAYEREIAVNRQRFIHLAATLDALSPLKVLTRGYSIVRSRSGMIIKRTDDVEAGERVDVIMQNGVLDCEVVSKSAKEAAKCPQGK